MKIVKLKRTQADIILALIENRMDDSNNAEFQLQPYDNGREHGYILDLHYVENSYVFNEGIWIAFSENRNSDSTVVYTDKSHFDEHITEKSYRESKMFAYGDFIAAADYIISLMEDVIEDIKTQREAEKEIEKESCLN